MPFQVTFHGMKHSDAIEETCREESEKLQAQNDRLGRVRVVVHGHPDPTRLDVHVEVTVPGKVAVAERSTHHGGAVTDITPTVHEVFRAVRRQLDDHRRRERDTIRHD